jgi:hypothetical protein
MLYSDRQKDIINRRRNAVRSAHGPDKSPFVPPGPILCYNMGEQQTPRWE